jgi:hypothetical protein
MSKIIDPSYLRYIHDGLESGKINKDNSTALPDGLVGMYEGLFPADTSPKERERLLNFFGIWALLKKEVTTSFVAAILDDWTEEQVEDTIATYSKWFNSPEFGKYQLYHERFRVYIFQKINDLLYHSLVIKILNVLQNSKKEDPSFEYAKNWKGFYLILSGKIDEGLENLIKRLKWQNESSWQSTFKLYLDIVMAQNKYEVNTKDITLFTRLRDLDNCYKAAKVISFKFDKIDWDKLEQYKVETRFHYALAREFENKITSLPEQLVSKIILNEEHFLSYVLSYSWKYFCWKNDKIPFRPLISKIKKNGSPYLRILLLQIDGGRKMLGKSSILKSSDYNDCWEYCKEDFIEFIDIGKTKFLEKFLTNNNLIVELKKNDLDFILEDFEQLHINVSRLKMMKKSIIKSNHLFDIVEILWFHPVWEIGEYGNEIIREKLQNLTSDAQILEFKNWIMNLSSEQNLFSAPILFFDIADSIEIDIDFNENLFNNILKWNDVHLRGQFLASANEFFSNNIDPKWLDFIKIKLFKFCEIATDIWETQEFISLVNSLDNRISTEEKNIYFSTHRIVEKISNGANLDWQEFWKKAEQLRKKGNI